MSEAASPPYDNIRQAYQHLLKYEDRAPYDYREDDNWVVAYFDQTLPVRLFPTLELVGKWYNWCVYKENVLVNYEQLAIKFTGVRLVEIYNHLRNSVAEKSKQPIEPALDETWNDQPLKVAKLVWVQFQTVGDRVTRSPQSNPSSQQHSDKYTVRVDLLRSSDWEDEIKKLPKQARVIAMALGDAEKSTYTEQELTSFARELAFTKKLKTKQDPIRVVKYYCPQLADLGLMSYPTKRDNSAGEE